jgi:L-threonylcarbamoyladenylate synthase
LRLYSVRGRDSKKPCIILCAEESDLAQLGIELKEGDKQLLSRIWPNPVSVILPCPKKEFEYLHRGLYTLAVRIPKDDNLREFLRRTGPLIAPSANPEGLAPSKSVEEARKYFGVHVTVYISGAINHIPSTLVKLDNGGIVVVRQGAWKLPSELCTMNAR